MKRIFLILLMTTSFVCKGQLSNTPTFLYMVLAKGDSIPSFLYGTIHHLGPKEILDNKQLMSYILSCKLIVQEADTSELLHPSNTKFNFNTDIALDQLLGFVDYQFVKHEYLQATGRDLDKYKFKMPLIIMSQIESAKEQKSVSKSKQPLMENALYALSVVKHIPIKGLETREDNFRIMYQSMPLKDQANLLLYALRNPLFNSTEEQMKFCWDKQDLSCFCKIDDMNHYTRPGDSTIIIKRNLFWINEITGYLKQKKVFIVVGAAHLCGDYGIIALLRKKGYKVVPILTNNKH